MSRSIVTVLFALALVASSGAASRALAQARDSAAVATAAVATAAVPPPAPSVAAPRAGGYIQMRETGQDKVGVTAILNRARFSLDGALPSGFSYRLLGEMEATAGAKSPSTPSLREAYVRWTRAPWTVSAGQLKTPFSRQYLIPIPMLEPADLATAVDSLAPKYDIGLMAEFTRVPWLSVSGGVFNGEGQNASANRDSLLLVVARVVATPIPQLALGASGTRDGADSLRWGVDANAEAYGALVRTEYITRQRRGRAHDRDDRGWYVFGAYRVVPRVQAFVDVEDFKRPWAGLASRVRSNAVGANVEIAPNRVKLLIEGLRRRTGLKQLRTDTAIAQLQVRF